MSNKDKDHIPPTEEELREWERQVSGIHQDRIRIGFIDTEACLRLIAEVRRLRADVQDSAFITVLAELGWAAGLFGERTWEEFIELVPEVTRQEAEVIRRKLLNMKTEQREADAKKVEILMENNNLAVLVFVMNNRAKRPAEHLRQFLAELAAAIREGK